MNIRSTLIPVLTDLRPRFKDCNLDDVELRVDDDLLYMLGAYIILPMIERAVGDHSTTSLSAAEARGALAIWEKLYRLNKRDNTLPKEKDNDAVQKPIRPRRE